MIEIWKDIANFEGLYQVSNLGRVRSLDRVTPYTNRWGTTTYRKAKGMLIKACPNSKYGHLTLNLWNGPFCEHVLVHHLVLETFVGPRPKGKEACHFPDRNPANNRVDNLRWDTHKKNHEDRLIHGTSGRGSRNSRAKLTEQQVKAVVALRKTGQFTVPEIADIFQVAIGTIEDILYGVTWWWLDK